MKNQPDIFDKLMKFILDIIASYLGTLKTHICALNYMF